MANDDMKHSIQDVISGMMERVLNRVLYDWTFDNFVDINMCDGNLYSTEHFEIRFSGELTWGLGSLKFLPEPQVN
jgi:hypothetical protein